MQLDELVKNSPTLDWPGIDSIFREYLCLYDNTSTQFRECKNRAELSFVASMSTMICNLTTHCSPSYSFDGDQFLLFYRRDLQVKDGWDVPKTWDELVEVAGKSCVPFDDCCIFFLTG